MWNADFIRAQLKKLPLFRLYPDICALIENVLIGWLHKFNHEVIRRMFRRNRNLFFLRSIYFSILVPCKRSSFLLRENDKHFQSFSFANISGKVKFQCQKNG